MTSRRSNSTAYLLQIINFPLRVCHNENRLKYKYQPNIRLSARVRQPFCHRLTEILLSNRSRDGQINSELIITECWPRTISVGFCHRAPLSPTPPTCRLATRTQWRWRRTGSRASSTMSSLDTAVKQHEVTHKCSHILYYNKQCCPAAAVIFGDFKRWLVVHAQRKQIIHMALM